MDRNSFDTWRTFVGSVVPTRFGSSVARFRRLQEGRRLLEVGEFDKVNNSSALDQSIINQETPEDKKIKKQVQAHQLDARREKLATLKRMKQLSMMDFNMTGGVSPIGSSGGSGGGDGYRPVSMGNKN